MDVSGQQHAPAAFHRGNNSGTNCIGDWVGPTTGLDSFREEEIFYPVGIRTPDCSGRCQSL
jgi:hypothetical protein